MVEAKIRKRVGYNEVGADAIEMTQAWCLLCLALCHLCRVTVISNVDYGGHQLVMSSIMTIMTAVLPASIPDKLCMPVPLQCSQAAFQEV